MRKNRVLQVLTAIAALVAATLAGIVTAAPAAACIGDCGTIDGDLYVGPGYSASYGYPVTLSGRVFDANLECGGGSAPPQICDQPTGTMTLSVDGVTFAEVVLTRVDFAEAEWGPVTYSGTPAGAHTFVAEYNGNFDSPTRFSEEYSIAEAETTTQLRQSVASTVAGQPTTLTAAVAPAHRGAVDLEHGAHLPAGQVEFFDGGTSLGKKDLEGETATATVVLSGNGNHDLYAFYVGDGDYAWSLSPALPHAVVKGDTATALTGPASATVYGQPALFTATVSALAPATGTPTGAVAFSANGVGFATNPVDAGGTATTNPVELKVGQLTVQATYGGDGSFNGSSAMLTHTVNKANTGVILNSPTSNPTTLGQPVTLQATVLAAAPGAGVPTGTVQFRDGTTPLGAPVPLSNQVATLTTSALGGGPHNITAVYSGDGNFNTGTSNLLSRTVTCTTTVSGNAGNVSVAPSGTTCITSANITGGVSIPAGAKVSIVNSTIAGYITANGGAGTLLLCGNTIGGITITGANGAVTIGDPTNACTANTVKGSIQAASNTGGLTIGGNTVAGWIQCSGNSPAPTNGGRSNTAAGRTGQCATPANF